MNTPKPIWQGRASPKSPPCLRVISVITDIRVISLITDIRSISVIRDIRVISVTRDIRDLSFIRVISVIRDIRVIYIRVFRVIRVISASKIPAMPTVQFECKLIAPQFS